MPCNSVIRLVTLAPQGAKKIQWVEQHMSVLERLRSEFSKSRPFEGKRIVARLHIEATTAILALLLRDAGAQVTLVAANPLSTQDDVAAALYEEGISVIGQYKTSQEEYLKYQRDALVDKPHAVIDTGGILTHLLHNECSHLAESFIGSSEESTTGIRRIETMVGSNSLKYPVVAVNNSLSKYLFENLHGTGQSVLSSIMNTTNLVVCGKVVVVIGYGWCGKGIARKARALGARVVICEIDPLKSSEALMDGFHVMPVERAVTKGDFIISATGVSNAIDREHFPLVKNKAILINAGHGDVEINLSALNEYATDSIEVANNITQLDLKNGNRIFLLAHGHIVNSAAGDGQPAEVMDISYALHILALKHLFANQGQLPNALIRLPREIDEYITSLFLHNSSIGIDELTEDQKAYFSKFPY